MSHNSNIWMLQYYIAQKFHVVKWTTKRNLQAAYILFKGFPVEWMRGTLVQDNSPCLHPGATYCTSGNFLL